MIEYANVERIMVDGQERLTRLKNMLHVPGQRLGLITSIDGSQLVTLLLDTNSGRSSIWETPLASDTYPSLTPTVPQCHWFERSTWDMFGLKPNGHPRLKHNLLHEPYDSSFFPLKTNDEVEPHDTDRFYKCLEVKGQGVYEIPVGPIHAGIIEPGHFRFSCLGEVVLNLEIRLGYVHRGIERRIVEVPINKMRFVAESAAGDMIAANALAHAVAVESCLNMEESPRARAFRTLSLELERIAMHVNDLGGIAGDIGFSAVSSSMAIVRGEVLGCAELLTGTRFQKGFITPGGVTREPVDKNLSQIRTNLRKLQLKIKPIIDFLFSNQVARDRMTNVGILSPKLAADFGVVGVAGRASGIAYDARQSFVHGNFPHRNLAVPVEHVGDVFSRAKVRVDELRGSLNIVDELLETLTIAKSASEVFSAATTRTLSDSRSISKLPPNSVGIGIVESFRGELIHLFFTDADGKIIRYAIKDPSVNNWTALAIAVRNNLLSDFPLCNKSFGLSYSGHDL